MGSLQGRFVMTGGNNERGLKRINQAGAPNRTRQATGNEAEQKRNEQRFPGERFQLGKLRIEELKMTAVKPTKLYTSGPGFGSIKTGVFC